MAATFPVLWQGDRKRLARLAELDCPRTVPRELIDAHAAGCMRNHSQTPERLAERGGLSPGEIVALVSGATGAEVWRLCRLPVDEEVAALKALLTDVDPCECDELRDYDNGPCSACCAKGDGEPLRVPLLQVARVR